MKRLLKFVVAGFAVIGVVAVALTVYIHFFLPHCTLARSAGVTSESGEYIALLEQSYCEDPGRSRAYVAMRRAANPDEQIFTMEIEGVNAITLTWADDRRLVVAVPASARVRKYDQLPGWPRVVERRKDQ